MSPELIAILGVGAALAFIIITGQWSFRSEIRAELRAASAERAAIRADLHALGERVARLEGAFPFLAARLPERAETPAA